MKEGKTAKKIKKVNIVWSGRRKDFISTKRLKNIALFTLEYCSYDASIQLNILITDNKTIQKFNKRFLNRDVPTDVIAFRYDDYKHSCVYGDIAISSQMARENANRFNLPWEQELILYVIHGILHILGYSDKSPHLKKKMQKVEDSILKQIL